MPRPIPKNPWARWALDSLERGVRAYAASLASLIGADQVFTKFDASLWELAVAALIGMGVSGAFSVAGKTRGAEDSASFLPANTDPPQTAPKKKR